MTQKILILGANGFIGNALVRALLPRREYAITGIDLGSTKLEECLSLPRFRFVEADVTEDHLRVEKEIRECDVVLPLVAIATPALYVKEPLRVFELDFEENLRVIRWCAQYDKRIVFPSTSEVYGMSQDHVFDEDTTPLVMGPIHKQRWIYGCLKQLLDRVIWAYGFEEGLAFSIFRPFNWIGPRLDTIEAARIGSSRVVTQFIASLIDRDPIVLVDGGLQLRCFTYISDGIDALVRIIQNRGGCADQQVFNVGNPENECSVKELAARLHRIYQRELGGDPLPVPDAFQIQEAGEFYGEGYQDLVHRRPSIRKARTLLGWRPRIDLDDALRRTLRHFLTEAATANGIHGIPPSSCSPV